MPTAFTISDNLGALEGVFTAAVAEVSDYRMKVRVTRTRGGIQSSLSGPQSLFDLLTRGWVHTRKQLYDSQGQSEGQRWPRYWQTAERRQYAVIKAKILGRRMTPADLLRWEPGNEVLRPSLLDSRHRLFIRREGKRAITLGTAVTYAINHDQGIGRAPKNLGGHAIPRRRLVVIGPNTIRNFELRTVEWAGGLDATWGKKLAELKGVRLRGGGVI